MLAWKVEEELLDCLAALASGVPAESYEVVLVLNGASPATRQLVDTRVTGAVVVDLPYNVGFGGGCNAGAGVARGEFIVFLNDDAFVEPDWLRTLLAAARARPDAGAIASLLLDLSGLVQEAGSRVHPDGGTEQFGRGLSLAEAEEQGLLGRREIDYGSAAALLVRADAFRAVKGFDPAFEPAYYEDVDLQFRLRLAGWPVLLEPTARVAHISGASTSTRTHYREWASWRSSATFRSRWDAVLVDAPLPGTPVSELCQVHRADPALATEGRDLATTEQIASGAARTALALADAYCDWMEHRLDAADAALDHFDSHVKRRERDLAETEAALIDLRERNEELEKIIGERQHRIGEMQHRLHDLDNRGLIGMMKWRAGLIIKRRAARRNEK